MWSPEKIHELEQKLVAGWTVQECADYFKVSKARISQVKLRHLAHLSSGHFGRGLKVREKIQARREELLRKFNRPTFQTSNALEAAQAASFARKKGNVNHGRGDWEFTITMSDLDWPTHCPILGLELDWFAETRQENSPSYDRVDSTKGYVPGNVVIVSWRANRIKNDGTAQEHFAIAEWLNKQVDKC